MLKQNTCVKLNYLQLVFMQMRVNHIAYYQLILQIKRLKFHPKSSTWTCASFYCIYKNVRTAEEKFLLDFTSTILGGGG